MAERLVIGLFQSSGIALDAAHRLVTEGVSSSDIAHRVLKRDRSCSGIGDRSCVYAARPALGWKRPRNFRQPHPHW